MEMKGRGATTALNKRCMNMHTVALWCSGRDLPRVPRHYWPWLYVVNCVVALALALKKWEVVVWASWSWGGRFLYPMTLPIEVGVLSCLLFQVKHRQALDGESPPREGGGRGESSKEGSKEKAGIADRRDIKKAATWLHGWSYFWFEAWVQKVWHMSSLFVEWG